MTAIIRIALTELVEGSISSTSAKWVATAAGLPTGVEADRADLLVSPFDAENNV